MVAWLIPTFRQMSANFDAFIVLSLPRQGILAQKNFFGEVFRAIADVIS